ncbi:MAG: hypothetical protein AB7F22_15070 [Reyranella sp.]|uniref:hypothetical protein n=1 Tax=Reyranella sp. TaxID=1929291 RepID=UPI003D0DAC9B
MVLAAKQQRRQGEGTVAKAREAAIALDTALSGVERALVLVRRSGVATKALLAAIAQDPQAALQGGSQKPKMRNRKPDAELQWPLQEKQRVLWRALSVGRRLARVTRKATAEMEQGRRRPSVEGLEGFAIDVSIVWEELAPRNSRGRLLRRFSVSRNTHPLGGPVELVAEVLAASGFECSTETIKAAVGAAAVARREARRHES